MALSTFEPPYTLPILLWHANIYARLKGYTIVIMENYCALPERLALNTNRQSPHIVWLYPHINMIIRIPWLHDMIFNPTYFGERCHVSQCVFPLIRIVYLHFVTKCLNNGLYQEWDLIYHDSKFNKLNFHHVSCLNQRSVEDKILAIFQIKSIPEPCHPLSRFLCNKLPLYVLSKKYNSVNLWYKYLHTFSTE